VTVLKLTVSAGAIALSLYYAWLVMRRFRRAQVKRAGFGWECAFVLLAFPAMAIVTVLDPSGTPGVILPLTAVTGIMAGCRSSVLRRRARRSGRVKEPVR
jgi:hypothetical protein